MTSLKINLKSLDQDTRFLSSGRTVEITTKKGTITTPTRASTSYEFKRKAQVPTDIPIDNDISVNIQKLNFKRIQGLLTTNESLQSLSRRIDLNNRLEQYSKLRVSVIQPTSSESTDIKTGTRYPSGMDLLVHNNELLKKFLSIIINTQYRMGLDVITIPFLDLPSSIYKKIITEIANEIEKYECYPFFVVDMKYTAFPQIIEHIFNNTSSRLIGIYFRDYLESVQSYYTLSKYSDKDIAFFAMQVERIDVERDNISAMHYLPFLANDIYSVEIPSQFVPNPIQHQSSARCVQPSYKLTNIKLFDRTTLQIDSIGSAKLIQEKIEKEYNHDQIIQEMLENYTEASTDETKYGMLNAFSKLDELRSSSFEFNRLREFISQESTKDYLDEKTTLKKVLKPMSKPKPSSWFE